MMSLSREGQGALGNGVSCWLVENSLVRDGKREGRSARALRPSRTEECYLCDLNARSSFSLQQFLLLFSEAANGSHGLVVL